MDWASVYPYVHRNTPATTVEEVVMRYWTNKYMLMLWLIAVIFGTGATVNALLHPEESHAFAILCVLLFVFGAILLPILWKRSNRQLEKEWEECEEEWSRQEEEAEKKEKKKVKQASP